MSISIYDLGKRRKVQSRDQPFDESGCQGHGVLKLSFFPRKRYKSLYESARESAEIGTNVNLVIGAGVHLT